MAVVNVKSQIVTDLDATPIVKTNPLEIGGVVRSAYGIASFAASDATSVARLVRVPVGARVTRLEYASDKLGVGGTIDIGLHQPSDGAVLAVSHFASALNTDTAAVARTDVTYESGAGVVSQANQGKTLWEQAGVAANPGGFYDITATRNTAAATGAVQVWVEYVLPE